MATPPTKRPSPPTDDYGPPSKKIKALPEEPAQYSDAVRKKLASTSRTGQACDRCKERKMKCDTDPAACQPCRQKGLRCYTTDRVTGQARERGETGRAENELSFLREQLAAYQHRYGPLQRAETNGHVAAPHRAGVSVVNVQSTSSIPDSRYVGWPSPDHSEPLRAGPVSGTVVDILEGTIDIADWKCDMMEDYPKDIKNKFNLSRTSIINTVCGYQRVEDPRLPPREEAVRDANHFLTIMSQYVPIVHRPTFIELVHRFYDQPSSLSPAETTQVVLMLAIINHQTGVRNHSHSAERFEDSHRYLHYGLGYYRDLYHDRSLASMQAMAMVIIHFRNLPKPGLSWIYCHTVLIRAIELDYHRDPDQVQLPPEESDPLSKELRKRVFHAILTVCVTTGCKVGLPAPWQFQHIDLPLQKAIQDSEISKRGISSTLSGQCDFWPAIQLSKLLPLLTELHNSILSVRKPPPEYIKTVEALNSKIIAWKQDWDDTVRAELKQANPNMNIATLLMDSWAAEYQLNLHHPVCCPSKDPELLDRNLDMCHKSAKRLLQNFHILSQKYKGVDFTWHSTVAYATGFGITLYVYNRRKAPVTMEQFENISNELKGWKSLMAYADLVLRTGNHLQRQFNPRVQALEDDYRRLILDTPTRPTSNQTPFSPVNGTHLPPPTQQGSTPVSSYPELHTTHNHRNAPAQPISWPQSQEQIRTPVQPQAQPQPQSQWPTPFNYLPQPNANSAPSGAQIASPIFPSFSRSSASPTPGQSRPTSLASLLNDSGSLYVSYPTPPQTHAAFGAGNGDIMMEYSANHYYDGPGPLGWPLISMPPGQQSQ